MPPRASARKNTAAPASERESRERATSPRHRALRFEDEDEDAEEASGSAMALAPFSTRAREVSIRKIRVRGTMPLIASTLCVVCTALVAVCLQSWHIHATAMALASVRVSATNVKLAPATRRLKSLEDAVRRLEEETARVSDARAGGMTREMKDAALAAAETHAANAESRLRTEMRKEVSEMSTMVSGLKKEQGAFATKSDVKKMDSTKSVKKLQGAMDAVQKAQADFVSVSRVDALFNAVEALKDRSSYVTTSDLDLVKRDLVTKSDLKKMDSTKSVKTLQSALDKLRKVQSGFVTSSEMKKMDVSKDINRLDKSIKSLTKSRDGADVYARLQALEAAVADAAKASVNFASVRQLEDVVAKATKSTPNDAPTVSQFNALVDTVDAVRNAQAELLPKSDLATFESQMDLKVTKTQESVDGLLDSVEAIHRVQQTFATNATIKIIEAQLEALKVSKKRTSFLTRQKALNVSQEHIAALEASVATLHKQQSELEKKQADALGASDLKSVKKSIATLEKAQADFVTTAQLQKVEVVMDEIKSLQMEIEAVSAKQANFVSTAQLQKVEFVTEEIQSLQSEISALAKTQGEFAVLSAGLKDLEQKLATITDGAQKKSLLAKFTKKTETQVSSKQLVALENSIAALTKAQAGFAQSTTLAALESSLAALEKKQADALGASDLKSVKKSIATLEKAQADFVTTAQLQKVDVTREVRHVEDAVEQLLKEQGAYATQTSVNVLEAQVEALSGKTKSSGYFKRATDTLVSSKQIKALEDAVSSLTKSQSNYATSTQLKEILTVVDTLSKSQSEYASLRALGDLETKLKDFASSEKAPSVQETKVVDLEKQLLERVNQYIKAIPKDTARKLTKHIDEAANLWFADRTGRQDFALASGGGRVVAHSQLSPFVARGDGPITAAVAFLRGGVHPKSDEWLLSPSLEQPGDCIALHSSTGYVDIRLRQSVMVDAVTLEHTNSLNAYDMHSAPRDIEILGWLSCNKNKCKNSKPPKSLLSLGNYTYSVSHGSVQTYEVEAPQILDHVRLVVKNNQGHKKWTCLYRFRVHGTATHVEA